jgi:hypothetical protein
MATSAGYSKSYLINPAEHVRRCFRIARAALERGGSDDAAVAIIMAVAAAESFLTIQALEIAELDPRLKNRILRDLRGRVSFEAKLAEWPRLLFASALDFDRGPGARLLFAKSRRNALLHGAAGEAADDFVGLGSDPSIHPISLSEASEALDAALWFIEELLRRRGLSDLQIRNLGPAWTG